MHIRQTVTVLMLAALAACSGREDAAASKAAADAQAAQQLTQLVEEFWDKFLALNPLYATFNGDYRFNNRLENNIGPEYLAQSLALDRDYLGKLQAIDPAQLAGQARLSYDIFKFDRELSIEGARYPGELLPINQFFGMPAIFAQLGAGSGVQPFETVKDYDDWLARVHDFEVWMNQAVENLRAGIAKGVVQPRIVMEKALPQLEAMIVTDPTRSLFYQPVTKFPDSISEPERARLTAAFSKAITGQIVPAYARVRDFVRDEYLSKTRSTIGLNALPDGDAWYAYLVKLQTTTAMTPNQLHELGRSEVARIHAEMQQVMRDVGFKGDLQAFFAFLRADPRFYCHKSEDLLAGYRALKDGVAAQMPKLFAVTPKADFEIRPVEEFLARSAASASYRAPTPDGKRPGVFYVNTFDLRSRPKYSMESIYLHEAVPGHHFQIAIQQELESLPRFRRFGGYTAYAEGWGLYAESLGRELGLYTDPYNHFGALGAEIFRAVRLVVDTGIHSQGWSREQAIEYLSANAPIGKSDAIAEIERYIANPGQALSYKVGELKLKELRARAAAALGEKFDLRGFHTQVLVDGALPLEVLDAKIQRWIDSQKT